MALKTKGIIPRMWRKLKRLLLILFILHLLYLFLLKWIYPPITLTQASAWISGDGLKRDYVAREEISSYARLAVIASEDQLFPDHNGFDWKSINKAIDNNRSRPTRVRGASTISQQVAKNVFLWQGRSWVRKGLEVYFTFMIELIWGKKRILDIYLNVIEMGKGVYGIQAASREFFNKDAAKLNRREAAMIAAALPNPKRYTIKPLSRYVSNRQQWVIRQMNNIQSDPDIQELITK